MIDKGQVEREKPVGIMKNLLTKGPGLEFQAKVAETIGLNEAIVLQQVLHLLSEKEGKYRKGKLAWIAYSYSEWNDQFPFWSEVTVRRTIRSLERKELLLSKAASSLNRVKYYTVNYSKLKSIGLKLNQALSHSLQVGDQNDQARRPKVKQ